MRVAAVADIHLKAEDHEKNVSAFSPVNDLADALVVAGDFTNHGLPDEMRACLAVLEQIKIPIIAVLGNHDHESGHQDELAVLLRVVFAQGFRRVVQRVECRVQRIDALELELPSIRQP